MSAFYDLASLVLVPSGYKASKVYAQKPLTTDGQLTFSRASTATRVNSAGLIETVSSNVPRLDYLNSSCPRLLLEPQRTNLITFSESFDNAGWSKFNTSVTANTATSPDGYTNADKLVEDTSTAFHDVDQARVYTAAAHTISVFAKAAERNHIFLQHFDGTTFFTSGTFNLSNGTVSGSGTIENYGNGWYRCSFTATTVSGTGASYINLSNGTTGNYAGNGTSGVFLWGAQVEAGAYATSYIPTLGAAVTRGADAASKTGISSLIGQTEGTLYWEGVRPEGGNDFSAFGVTDGTTNNEVFFRFTTEDRVEFYLRAGGTQPFAANTTAYDLNQNTKIAFAYKLNDVAVYVNGDLIGTGSPATMPATLNQLNFSRGNSTIPMVASVSQTLLFKTRLTNAQLAELTTL